MRETVFKFTRILLILIGIGITYTIIFPINHKIYDPLGNLQSSTEYRFIIKHGDFQTYYADGKLLLKGKCFFNKFNDTLTMYYHNGNIKSKTYYDFGEIKGLDMWGYYGEHQVIDGVGNFIDSSKSIIEMQPYKNNKRNGVGYKYTNGNVSIITWKNDYPIDTKDSLIPNQLVGSIRNYHIILDQINDNIAKIKMENGSNENYYLLSNHWLIHNENNRLFSFNRQDIEFNYVMITPYDGEKYYEESFNSITLEMPSFDLTEARSIDSIKIDLNEMIRIRDDGEYLLSLDLKFISEKSLFKNKSDIKNFNSIFYDQELFVVEAEADNIDSLYLSRLNFYKSNTIINGSILKDIYSNMYTFPLEYKITVKDHQIDSFEQIF